MMRVSYHKNRPEREKTVILKARIIIINGAYEQKTICTHYNIPAFD